MDKNKMFCSMYRGEKMFDREQLVFMVEVIMASAFDNVESVLPPNVTPEEYLQKEGSISTWINSAVESAGWNLSILYAQLTGDGMGVGDAVDASVDSDIGLRGYIWQFVVSRQNRRRYKKGEKITPDCREWAEKWVDEVFKEYLS